MAAGSEVPRQAGEAVDHLLTTVRGGERLRGDANGLI